MSGGPSEHVTTTDTAKNALSSFTGGGANTGYQAGSQQATLPPWLQSLVPQFAQTAGNAVQGYEQLIPGITQQIQPSIDTLTSLARGDQLYGGPGQQEYIDAATRAAAPGINSMFGQSGRAGSGLNAAAFDQQALDSFARLFTQNADRQYNAALGLPGVATVPAQLQQQLASLAGGLPGQFSPFLGTNTTGMTSGTTSQYGTQKSKETGKQTETQPIYQPPWWQTALGVGAGVAGMAVPGLGGVSALGNAMNLFGPGTVR